MKQIRESCFVLFWGAFCENYHFTMAAKWVNSGSSLRALQNQFICHRQGSLGKPN